ncbi:siderophore-interacting protein [Agromyces ramosus]|uniref:NADPH-dependent ferric siderophore reductase n=1 Tax=Agromyces ramosus TaxID=33879 RepID=A0ABU0RBQ0_9MICO|nr:siderophore-interacting protein [Agromyces ramosus]MDQ0895504.1 NADPH-dependent ferric siderophore reductase [Agromyces ramosus]
MAKPGYRVFETVVGEIERMSPHFVRVTFRSDDLRDVGWDGPDQRIKVVLPVDGTDGTDGGYDGMLRGDDWLASWRALADERRNPIRTYTIRGARPEFGELVVDFVAHGDSGPASRWIAAARVGDPMLLVAPDATSEEPSGGWEWNPGAARTLLIAGDETAVPAMSVILEQLPADARGAVFLEVPDAADALELVAPDGVEVRWLAREPGSEAYGASLVEAVTGWADAWAASNAASNALLAAADAELPALTDEELVWEVPEARADDGLYAWLAGEASAITTLRRHLVKELGIDRRQVAFMGYWKLGRAEG